MNTWAFPVYSDRGERIESSQGMTLRDYFAAKAMQGMCANSGLLDPTFEGHRSSMSKAAYFLADAMLAERDK